MTKPITRLVIGIYKDHLLDKWQESMATNASSIKTITYHPTNHV